MHCALLVELVWRCAKRAAQIVAIRIIRWRNKLHARHSIEPARFFSPFHSILLPVRNSIFSVWKKTWCSVAP